MAAAAARVRAFLLKFLSTALGVAVLDNFRSMSCSMWTRAPLAREAARTQGASAMAWMREVVRQRRQHEATAVTTEGEKDEPPRARANAALPMPSLLRAKQRVQRHTPCQNGSPREAQGPCHKTGRGRLHLRRPYGSRQFYIGRSGRLGQR